MIQFNRDDPPQRDHLLVAKEVDFTVSDGAPLTKLSPMAADVLIEGECTFTFESSAAYTEFVRAARRAVDAFAKFREGLARIARSMSTAPITTFFETFIDTPARRYRRRLRARPKLHRPRRFNGRLRPLRRNSR